MTGKTDLPPYRPCDLCGGVDQDPRHSFAGVIADTWPVLDEHRANLDANLEQLISDGKVSVSEAVAVGAAYADTSSTDRHIDCCAAAGCPLKGTDQDESACDHRVAAANGKTGEGMRKAALSLRKDA